MAYDRTKRIGEEIKKVISQMLLDGQIKDSRLRQNNGLISITNVDVVRDLKYANVYVSVLNGNRVEVMEGLQSAAGYIRKEVGRQIDLRYTPQMIFHLDDSIEHGAKMSKLIRDVNED